jgi:hypothetical protein
MFTYKNGGNLESFLKLKSQERSSRDQSDENLHQSSSW